MSKRYFSTPKKAILFDLNHTIIDEKASARACFIDVLQEFTGRWSKDGLEWEPKQVALQYEKKLNRGLAKRKKTKLSLRKLKWQSLRTALEPYPIIVNDEFVRAFFKRMGEHRINCLHLYSQTGSILTTLSKQYKLGIITNRSNITLKQIGLADILSDKQLITPLKARQRKPHPAIFRHAVATLNVKPEEAVMVGNSWPNDIIGATKAGFDAIWVNRAPTTPSKHITSKKVGKRRVIVIKSLNQLLEIF